MVRRVLREVADALAYAHAHGVVHRDVKPDNVLLDRESGRAVVTDFGIARAAEGDGRLTVTGVAVGTPAYMSPEQALGERDVDGRSDIYSLGIVGYEMLAGGPPFEAGNTPAMLMKQLSELPRPLAERRPDAPRNLVAAIERALLKERSARWPDARAFRDALAGDAVAATPAVAAVDGARPVTPTDFGWHPVDRQLRDRARERLSGERNRPVQQSRDGENGARGDLRREPWRSGRDLARRDGRSSRESRHSEEGKRQGDRPLDDRIHAFRHKVIFSAGIVSFLGVINLTTSPMFPWVIFPAIGMASDLLRRWSSISRDGVGFWEAMLGDGGAARRRAEREGRAPVAVSGPPVVDRVRRLRTGAAVTAGLGAVAVGATTMGAVTGFDPYLGLAGLTALGAGFGAMITTARAFSLRRIGVRLSDALGSGWKQAALLADPRPREAKLAEAMAALAPREVTDGAHGPTVRRAVEDQAAIREIVFKLSPADRALLPDIQPTVDALVERVVALATSLHRLDADLPPGAIAELDARLGAAARLPGGSPEERERHIALLHRQRESLADLAERRTNFGAQLERASLMLQNIRLDLVKLRSSGVGAFADATNATQEARALSRDIGHVLDAAREVRKI